MIPNYIRTKDNYTGKYSACALAIRKDKNATCLETDICPTGCPFKDCISENYQRKMAKEKQCN